MRAEDPKTSEETLVARLLRAAHRGHVDGEGNTDARHCEVCSSYLEEAAGAIVRLQEWIGAFGSDATPEDLEAWKRTALFVSQPDFFERLEEALVADGDGMTSEEVRAYLDLSGAEGDPDQFSLRFEQPRPVR